MQAFVLAAPPTTALSRFRTARALCARRNSFLVASTFERAVHSRFHTCRSGSAHIAPVMREAADGDSVNVHYTGFLDDGSKFDSSRDRGDPLNFVVGAGAVIRGFDDAVRGLKVGESRRTRIEPDRAYGMRSDDLVVSLPRQRVPQGMTITPGMRLPLSNGMMGIVLEVTDDAIRVDANHELAGKTLTFDMELVGFQETVLPAPTDGLKRAVFGLGCFWGAELAYQRVPGVVSTKVGYTQGQRENPTYREVCSGTTGHAEAVAVDYDPSAVSYEKLVDLFWERLGGSALTLNQVGNDVGTQYRSGVYFLDEDQKAIAEASAKAVSEKLGQAVVVEVVSGEEVPFYLAETYHQRYLEKGGQSAEKNATETIRCYG